MNLVSRKLFRITGAVHHFVVLGRDGNGFLGKPTYLCENLPAVDHVLAHLIQLVRLEPARFVENLQRHARLAHIVEQRGRRDHRQYGRGHPFGLGLRPSPQEWPRGSLAEGPPGIPQ